MNQGQIQFEALACFLVFLALLALTLNSVKYAEGLSRESVQALEAKKISENCCLLVDSAYSNGIQEMASLKGCVAEKNSVKGVVGEKAKASECLAKKAKSVQKNSKSVLEVELCEHYR